MKFHKQSIFYLMIFVFIMGIFYCLYNIFCVEFDNIAIKTIYASLIIGLISSIGLFINLINNIETKEQTNRLIQENVNNRFINIISNALLLNDLPYSLRKFIENKFEDIVLL